MKLNLSLIVCTLNSAQTILSCLNSSLVLLKAGVELILVDGRSNDKTIKYVLEFFLEKISDLSPHTSQNRNYYIKKTKSLESTKKHIIESQSLTGVELKEFSLLFLINALASLICKSGKYLPSSKISSLFLYKS